MQTPFNKVAQALRGNGYSVLPIYPGTKIPGDFIGNQWQKMTGWSRFCSMPVGDVEFSYWMTYPDAGIAIACGEASQVIALDFDSNIDGIHDKILTLIPESPVKKRGKTGFTAFYRYNGEKAKKFSKDGVMVFEILSNGNQTVIPPTIHPDTNAAYTWESTTLMDVKPESLPAISSEAIDAIYKLFESKPKHTPQPISMMQNDDDDIENALRWIPADDYEKWVQIGMALKDKYGDHGFTYWDRWSQTSHKYNPKGMRSKWASFKNSGISIATVFGYAQENGYINVPPEPDTSMINIDNILKAKKQTAPSNTVEPELIELSKTAPHTLGLLIDFILKTSQYPQPVLALGASIGVLGALQAHKIRTENNARTNIFSLGLAHSGAGKDHARQACMYLLNKTGNSDLIGGDPASATGLLKSLEDGAGRRIMFMDEFGRVQEGMKSNAASHLAAIPTTLLKLFSSAGGTFHGNEYANRDGKSPRVDIDQPCLSIYATSVPSRLYKSLSSMDAIDGFLSRWLIFESNDYPSLNRDALPLDGVPADLKRDITYWTDAPTNMNPKGNLSALAIDPKVVPFDDEAMARWDQFAIEQRQKCRESVKSGDGMEAVYSRLAEHAQKIALIAHDPRKGYIDTEVIDWALRLVTTCGKYMVDSITSKIADNQQEADTNAVLNIIRKHGTVTAQQLARKLRRLKRKERNEILNDLIEAGEITHMVDADPLGRMRVKTYSIL